MMKKSKYRTEPWVGFNGPVSLCILLLDIQCEHFNVVMFTAVVIIRFWKLKKDLLIKICLSL
jgi:hypothetical protein